MNKRSKKTIALILSSALAVTGIIPSSTKNIVCASNKTVVKQIADSTITPYFTVCMMSDNSIWDTQTPQTEKVPVGELPKVAKGDSLEFTFVVQELDAATGTDFPAFTATLTSHGGFWGWNQNTGEDDSWKVTVNAPGEYSISVIAPADWDYSGIFRIDTDLKSLPEGYAIRGKTATLGSKTYDWSSAELYGPISIDSIYLSIWNEYDDNKKSNPLIDYQYTEPWMEEDWVAAKEWSTPVSKFGDFTVKGTAVQNANSNLGALYIDTGFPRIPKDYSIIGKSLKIGDKEYDWSGAKAYRNTASSYVRLSLWDAKDDDEYANPINEDINVKAGDVIEATFSVTDEVNPNPDFIATLTTNSSSSSIHTPDLKVSKGDTLEFIFTVTAPKDASGEDFPSFTATLTSYGGFWGWNATTGEDDSWKVKVNAPGEYIIRVTAPTDWEYSGAFCVETDLTTLPLGYAISGKTAILGDNIYDWHNAKAYKDAGTIRLSIWNEWNIEPQSNPLLIPHYTEEAMRTAMVRKFGDYTLKITAPQDADSHTGTFIISTDLIQIPPHYSIVGKTVKIRDKIYDWSNALPYKNSEIRLSLWDARSKDIRANPIAEDITIKKGDVVEATFSVTDGPNYTPNFTATLTSKQSIWNTRTPQIRTQAQADIINLSIKKGDLLEFHFTVKALDLATEKDFPSFTATLASYGGFWGWNQSTPGDGSWQIPITAPGDYSFRVTAPADWDFSGAFRIDTDLTELPSGVAISGNTAILGDKTYDWHCARAYIDAGYVRLGIWNEWGKDENGDWSINGSPLGYKYTEAWMAEKWTTAEEWTTTAIILGDHAVKGVATQNATTHSGVLAVETDLSEIPKGYTVSGKTVIISGKEYDWSNAELYRKSNGTITLPLWDAEDSSENANPLGKDIEIKAGDEIEAIFTIQKAGIPLQTSQPTDTPQPADTPKPTDTPEPTNMPDLTNTPMPMGTPKPTETPVPMGTPVPTDTQEPTDTPAPTDTQEPTKAPDSSQKPEPGNTQKPTPLAKNKTFTSGSLKYKVTTAAKKKNPAKVSVIGLSPSGKRASSINVKNTVSYSGISYKVTAVGSSAFKNSARLTKATLGTSIEIIPANAFNGCKKLASVAALGATKINQSAFKNCKALKKLTLRERISVKKGAFKGCKKTIKVTGSSKKINKANVKKLKKCGYKKFK